jgi:hypothetical protein
MARACVFDVDDLDDRLLRQQRLKWAGFEARLRAELRTTLRPAG